MSATPYTEGFRAGWEYGLSEGHREASDAYIKALDSEGFNGTAIGHLMKLAQERLNKIPARVAANRNDTLKNEPMS